MRAGGCALQQGLTAEAAGVVKQAVTLARRRGHAQVTPLHVASTMLSASTGLLRTACLQSHSHPLQCKALELCFNVALNRLPASNSSPVFGGAHSHGLLSQSPSISNALIAAFKRAQAHQRRGSIESQQQPLLAVKIELEQLIISILDDPSVSRVMREAGFSSTQVKSNVEQAVSLEICSTAPLNSASTNNCKSKESTSNNKSPNNNKQRPLSSTSTIRSEDVNSVVECLASKRKRSLVVVGECIDSIEGVVKGVMEKVEKEDVPEGLRDVKFITLSPLSSLRNYSRAEVDQELGELKSLLRSCMGKGVILYLGDLKWATEFRANSISSSSNSNSTNSSSINGGIMRGSYCPVEHMVMEIGKLVCGIGESGRFWLVGIATFQTYMRCKSGQPSLETIWGVHPLTIPSGSLRLTLLTTESDLKSDESTSKNGTSKGLMVELGVFDKLNCCAECSAKFEDEVQTLRRSPSTTSNLPAWLQQCRNESKGLKSSNHDQNYCLPVSKLCKKWNSYCHSTHKKHQQPNNTIEKTLMSSLLSPVSPFPSASGFSYDHHHHSFHQNPNQALRMYFSENKDDYPWKLPIPLFPPNNINNKTYSNPTPASSSDAMETEYAHKFKELNSENLKTMCDALERRVPWQREIIPEIASTVLKCRSGLMTRRKLGHAIDRAKEETWLFFQGVDTRAKEKIAKELAKLVFGSQDEFVSVALSSFSSSTRADSTEDFGKNYKRSRDEQSCSYIERFGEAILFNPRRVFFVEDVEQADYRSQMGFKRAIERGKVTRSSGEEVELRDAIVILSCESFSSRSRACSPSAKQMKDVDYCQSHDRSKEDDHNNVQVCEDKNISPCLSLDLNISFDDCNDDENVVSQDCQSIDDIGLLECVDRRIVFKVEEL